MTEQNYIRLYLDYFNNFITVRGFADYYGLSINEAHNIINIGHNYNNGGSLWVTWYCLKEYIAAL